MRVSRLDRVLGRLSLSMVWCGVLRLPALVHLTTNTTTVGVDIRKTRIRNRLKY